MKTQTYYSINRVHVNVVMVSGEKGVDNLKKDIKSNYEGNVWREINGEKENWRANGHAETSWNDN